MSIYAHIDSLNDKHHIVSQQIKEAYRHHESDEHLRELKKRRLLIEEDIEKHYGMMHAEKRVFASAA